MSARDKTQARIYASIARFNETAQWDVLRLAQMRDYLAEHIAADLTPDWLLGEKAKSAGEEIAHVLLMVGLSPQDWLDAYRAEVLAEPVEVAATSAFGRLFHAIDRRDYTDREALALLGEHIAEVRREDASLLRDTADKVDAAVQAYYGRGIGRGACDMLRFAADDLDSRAEKMAPAPARLTVYRAEMETIPLDHYLSEADARRHCEDTVRDEHPGTELAFVWRGGEDDPEEPRELFVRVDGGEEQSTLYLITPLPVATSYDPEAGEDA